MTTTRWSATGGDIELPKWPIEAARRQVRMMRHLALAMVLAAVALGTGYALGRLAARPPDVLYLPPSGARR